MCIGLIWLFLVKFLPFGEDTTAVTWQNNSWYYVKYADPSSVIVG